MSNRRNPTENQKIKAWENVAGEHPDLSKVYSRAKCPYAKCQYPKYEMEWNNYGTSSEVSWVVDHKKPLSRGGSSSPDNLQAMHNICNNIKGDE